MKTTALLVLALSTTFPSLGGNSIEDKTDNVKKANVTFEVRTKINASADDVWKVLGEKFDKISEWTEFVESSVLVESTDIDQTPYTPDISSPVPARKTKVINKGRTSEIIEVVTMYSEENKSLKFYGVGLPRFILFASDVQSVVPIGENECEVVFKVEMRVKGVFKVLKNKLKKHFSESMAHLQNDLKEFVELGKSL